MRTVSSVCTTTKGLRDDWDDYVGVKRMELDEDMSL